MTSALEGPSRIKSFEYHRGWPEGSGVQCGGWDRLSQGEHGDLRQDDLLGGPGGGGGVAQRR